MVEDVAGRRVTQAADERVALEQQSRLLPRLGQEDLPVITGLQVWDRQYRPRLGQHRQAVVVQHVLVGFQDLLGDASGGGQTVDAVLQLSEVDVTVVAPGGRGDVLAQACQDGRRAAVEVDALDLAALSEEPQRPSVRRPKNPLQARPFRIADTARLQGVQRADEHRVVDPVRQPGPLRRQLDLVDLLVGNQLELAHGRRSRRFRPRPDPPGAQGDQGHQDRRCEPRKSRGPGGDRRRRGRRFGLGVGDGFFQLDARVGDVMQPVRALSYQAASQQGADPGGRSRRQRIQVGGAVQDRAD